MPLDLESTDFISHIDAPLSPTLRSQLHAQILAERDPHTQSLEHPSLPPAYETNFSPFIQEELSRIASKQKLNAIDLTRYEGSALEPPTQPTSPNSDEHTPELLSQWRSTLQAAYGLKTYLDGRTTNLSLLETYGKNAWLISNAGLEDELRALQREVEYLKGEKEGLEEERRRMGERVRSEMEGLEGSWRTGVRGRVEVEVATGELREEILRRKRAGVGG